MNLRQTKQAKGDIKWSHFHYSYLKTFHYSPDPNSICTLVFIRVDVQKQLYDTWLHGFTKHGQYVTFCNLRESNIHLHLHLLGTLEVLLLFPRFP